MALTPIARFDVVPRQRLEAGTTFNFGVVAFSKAGIANVTFTITPAGGTYQSEATVVTVVTSMTLNSRVDVWEYWTPIAASDFSADGSFTVGAVVTGDDAGTRDLGTITMFANPNGTLAYAEAWVTAAGNDGTGEANNESLPFATIRAATNAAQTANSGESGGNIIHIGEGTHIIATSSWTITTTSEWLVFKAADGATKANVKLQTGKWLSTSYLRCVGLQLESAGRQLECFDASTTNIWLDDCNMIGSSRLLDFSSPLTWDTHPIYAVTNCYAYDSRYAFFFATLARGCESYYTSDDAFVNVPCIINCVAHGLDHEGSEDEYHSDCMQWHSGPYDNRICYGFIGYDSKWQGIYIRATTDGEGYLGSNLALVNCLLYVTDTVETVFSIGAADIPDTWEHFLIWNCTFTGRSSTMYANNPFTNSSMIGNVYDDYRTAGDDPDPRFAVGNEFGNEALENHFVDKIYVSAVWADSDAAGSVSEGDYKLDLTTPGGVLFGRPASDSPLLDRFASKVPVDVYNRQRGATSDAGAVEYLEDTGIWTQLVMVLA